MRLRNVPGAREAMVESEYVVNEPKEYKGRWNELFGNSNPIRIEVGMGKGRFIMQLAAENPDVNYVGIEKYSSVLIRALESRRRRSFRTLFLSEWMPRRLQMCSERARLTAYTSIFPTHGRRTGMRRGALPQDSSLRAIIRYLKRTDSWSSRRTTGYYSTSLLRRLSRQAGISRS